MDLSSFKCPECNQYETPKLDSLRIHCQKKHSLSTQKLYAALFLPDGKEPLCACGCGEPGESFEKKSLIAEWVTSYHIEKNISGVVLCVGCHDVEHSVS